MGLSHYLIGRILARTYDQPRLECAACNDKWVICSRSTADKVHDFEFISLRERHSPPFLFRHDGSIAFDRYVVFRQVEVVKKLLNIEWGGDFTSLSVQTNFDFHTSGMLACPCRSH